ncbi:Emc2p [Lachancea thermotolerans CBS 6340]|uniref:ER membrane protein complex subunit 2 n=1 Tax=Lachancea thermotolerans (strain ATCC 56472 / CBS 6340 / NRRL Y-8284) TaxID=559295 RepID=C5DKU5_LACTC|nr:KLTH0F07612p [Lachancea thermotolerans CBS 6340]CAR24096.1 KLTH0F07612p [Lachancea thermotolerans CBS 6340]
MEILKDRYLTICSTKYYTAAPAHEVASLWDQLKTYLGAGDPTLSELDYMSLTHMLFDLSIYNGKDVEAETLFKTFRDRFGSSSPYLHVMQATLLQVNKGDREAEEFLTKLLKDALEYETDIIDYLLVSKKLLSIRRKSITKEEYLKQLLGLAEKFPVDGELWYAIAQEYASLGQFEQAAYSLEEVLCIAPFNYVAFAQLSEALYYRALREKKDKDSLLQQSLSNALRSVELSENFVKGWAFVAVTSKELSKAKLLNLSKKKLREIMVGCNDTDKATAKKILENL